MNVDILLFDDFETLDAFGPAEVFGKLPETFHIRYLSVSGDVINSAQGVKVWTDFLIPGEVEDILVIPGGRGARRLLWKDERSLKLFRRAAESANVCLMVGSGSALLAQTGLLYRRRIAEVPLDANWNRNFTAGIERLCGVKIAADGKYYSCSTTAAGIDMSLFAISELVDISAAGKAAEAMGYPWDPEQDEGIYC